MVGRGFGVCGVRIGCAAALLSMSFAGRAGAQSTASFPEPPGSAPPRVPTTPVAPPATPPPTPVAAKPAAPVPSAPPVAKPITSAPRTTPAPSPDSTTESRYPTLPTAPSAPPSADSVLAFYPAILPYRDGLPIPTGYKVEHRSANGLIAGGMATLLIAYGTAIAIGGGDNFDNGTSWVTVPVIGPWAAIGARSYHCDNDPLKAQQCIRGAFNQVQTIAILSADAVVQATGLVLLIAGLASGQDELVRSDLATAIRVTPRAVGQGGLGVGFDGRF